MTISAGIEVFSKLRHLDVSFNCVSSLSELTPLAYLHDLISVRHYHSHVITKYINHVTIIPRARFGYESITHEAEGRMVY